MEPSRFLAGPREEIAVKRNELSVIIGGHAGQGVQTVARAFARACSRAGFGVFLNQEYPSNIKGEHNYFDVMVAERRPSSCMWIGSLPAAR